MFQMCHPVATNADVRPLCSSSAGEWVVFLTVARIKRKNSERSEKVMCSSSRGMQRGGEGESGRDGRRGVATFAVWVPGAAFAVS